MKTNSLRFSTTVMSKGGNEKTVIKIRLDDECKNGHQDFAMTCDIYEKAGNGRWMDVGGGCAHEHISKVTKGKYDEFAALHLADWQGIPMYAVENGHYHMTNTFNDTSRPHEDVFCEEYRVTPEQYEILKKAENKIEYAILLKDLGILDQWKVQADAAIKRLEELTGDEFLMDSVKSQYNAPTQEQIDDFIQKKESGYYTDEQKKIRAEEKRQTDKQKKIDSIKEHAAKKIKEHTDDRDVALWILNRLDKLHTKPLNKGRFNIDFSFDNFIFYNHTVRIKFNWRDYGKQVEMTEREFKMFCDSINQADFEFLPANISFECGKVVYTNK